MRQHTTSATLGGSVSRELRSPECDGARKALRA